MRILVTGGAGFIGSHVVERLLRRGDDIVVLDSFEPRVHGLDSREPRSLSHLGRDSFELVHADICDRDGLRRAMKGVEGIVHLAAAVGTEQSMSHPHHTVRTNSGGTALLLELLAGERHRVEKLVVASSMAVYGEGHYICPACGGRRASRRAEEQLRLGAWEVRCADCQARLVPKPTPEDKPAEVTSVYGASKKNQEELVLCFARASGIPAYALRFFNVFGPGQRPSDPYAGVTAIFLSRLLRGDRPILSEDGKQTRDFTYVADAAEAVLRALDADGQTVQAVNVGTGRAVSLLDTATALAKSLDLPIEPEIPGRYRSGDVRHCFADVIKAKALLGFEARWSFEDGIRAFIEWNRGEAPRDRPEPNLTELGAFQLVQ